MLKIMLGGYFKIRNVSIWVVCYIFIKIFIGCLKEIEVYFDDKR